jgi:hypothetical protein
VGTAFVCLGGVPQYIYFDSVFDPQIGNKITPITPAEAGLPALQPGDEVQASVRRVGPDLYFDLSVLRVTGGLGGTVQGSSTWLRFGEAGTGGSAECVVEAPHQNSLPSFGAVHFSFGCKAVSTNAPGVDHYLDIRRTYDHTQQPTAAAADPLDVQRFLLYDEQKSYLRAEPTPGTVRDDWQISGGYDVNWVAG